MRLSRFAIVALVACSDATTNPVTQLNLDRPVDLAFACWGGIRYTEGANAGMIALSAQPIESCNIRSGPRASGDPKPVPPGQEPMNGQSVPDASWYAFVLQSGPGTVAMARFDTKPSSSFSGADLLMLDADPLIPGKNSISVGEDPIAIATDKVGCYEVIANAGSCDLSTLDINSAASAANGESVDPIVNRLPVVNAANQPIRARPAAMVFQPPGGTIGAECPATPQGLAYIAYPSCRLVAGVDVSTGMIVTGIQFDTNGVPTVVDGNVSCPADCDGSAPMPGIRPVALDLEFDARVGETVLAIGADNSNVITAYVLDQTYRPLSLISVPLQNTTGRLGVTSVAITPQIGMGGDMSLINDEQTTFQHRFIYAVTNDGSVRVADIRGLPRECDAQTDPRYLNDLRDVDRLSCLPVDPPMTPVACTMDSQCSSEYICRPGGTCGPRPRRPGARGPGIELIGDAIPTSVDVVRVEPVDNDSRIVGTPARMIGYFGFISAANGQTFTVNVDNDDYDDVVDPSRPLATPVPLVVPHQLRDNIPLRGLLAEEDTGTGSKFVCDDPGPDPDSQGGNQGGPRIAGNPSRAVPAGVIAPEQVGGLPSIRQVLCDIEGTANDRPVNELYFSAPMDVRESVFPDLRGLRADETWTLTWEGSLSNDKVDQAIDGPAVRMSEIVVNELGMRIVDGTRPFCDAGVEPFDVVQLRGCDPSIGDAGCPVGYTCYVHPQSQVTGIGACMLIDEAERLANTCRPYLTSLRRYTVGRTKSGELLLLPRKHVLRTTPLDGCVSDEQCEQLGDYAMRVGSSLLPGDPNAPTDPKTWRCQADPDRKPMGTATTGNRCLLVCNADTDCAFGTICQPHPGAGAGFTGYCMEGVVPPQSCVNAPQRYELRAGEAFAVLGTRQGYMHSTIADAGGNCVKDPNANPLMVGRIPLDAPACDPTADPRTGRLPDGTFEPNPCELTVQESEYRLRYIPGTCTLDTPDEEIALRDATAIRFRNRGLQLTIVDPTYQGDLMCHGDRAGTLANVPIVTPGYQIGFRQTAGFAPLTVAGIAPAFPIKVVRGPTESVWIIDEGDYLSTSINQPSTRGKVFRVESRALAIINLLE